MAQRLRTLLVLLVALAVLIAGCSSSDGDDTTTTLAEASEEGDGTSSTTVPLEDLGVSEMCRTLRLLNNAGVPTNVAAVAMEATDLLGATSQQRAAYGDLLVAAPREECDYLTSYADDIAYWLGY